MKWRTIIINLAMLFATANLVNSLNILGIFPYPGKSHFITFRVYLQELARRGHNLTVISHFPEDEPRNNYNDISIAGDTQPLVNYFPFDKSYLTLLSIGVYLVTSGRDSCKVMLANEKVQELITQKRKFDVVVVEQFNSDCPLAVAYKLEAPVVGITTNLLMPWHYDRFGIPENPAFVPFRFKDTGTKPNLFQRMEISFLNLYFKSMYYLFEQKSDQQTLAQYYDDVPPLESLAREIKFLLVYQNFILTGTRLLPANVIEVGGYHVAKSKPLREDLKKFMDDAEYGVIYISFGSMIKSSTMPADKLAAILGAMKNVPQRFIWKWENDTLTIDKDKVYIADWLPQVDILGHPKTLAFFSHAGMGGTAEAMHYGVPMVAMPMFGDQPGNSAAIEESGLGVKIQAENLTEENVLSVFKKVLDPRFRENVKMLSRAWHDRPQSPLDAAVYWTEFAARYPNITFRAPSADVPLYQYYNLDILVVCSLIVTILFYIVQTIFTVCSKINKNLFGSIHVKKEEKNKLIKID